MVLIALKNLIFGKSRSGSSKPLLPQHQQQGYSAVDRDDSSSSTLTFDGVSNPRVISDVIIGLSDGLTVPFALTAGLSSLGSTSLVITGGLAELVSGAISMGLGGFLAARSESEHYQSLLERAKQSHREDPGAFVNDVQDALCEFNLSAETIKMVCADIEQDENTVANFTVKMCNGLEEPSPDREVTSALTIGISYFLGGFVPLVPYFFTSTVYSGLIISVILMAVTLFLFGWIKTVVSIGSECPYSQRIWNGFSMLATGGIAASAAWALVRVIDN